MDLRYVGRRTEKSVFEFDHIPAKKGSRVGEFTWTNEKSKPSLKRALVIGVIFAATVFLFASFLSSVFGMSSSPILFRTKTVSTVVEPSFQTTSISQFVPLASKAVAQSNRRTKRMRTSKKFFTWGEDTAAEIHSHKLSDIVFVFHKSLNDDLSGEQKQLNTALVASLAEIAEEQTELIKDGEFKKEMLYITVSEEHLPSFRPLLNDKVVQQLPFGLVVELENNYKKFLFPHNELVAASKTPSTASDQLQFGENDYNLVNKGGIVDYLKDSVRNYMKGEMNVWVRSSSDEEHDGSSVWFITGEEFSKLVMDTTEDVLVMFTSSFCPHSEKVLPKYIELADKYVDVESMLFFKFDVTKHDVPHSDVQITSTPHFRFFKSGEKHIARHFNPPVALGESFTEWGSEFLMNNIGFPIDDENTQRRRQRRLERETRKAQRERAKAEQNKSLNSETNLASESH
eukprot:GDKJ01026221.1.p1 GENE.GDKJ01026221.1~~GDKJ01026221.1.p1  ORF type:complete len:457 (-),score=126.36 GDKJ01026221.1:395-1765(-)